MSDKPLLYLSGKMTGEPEWGYPVFNAAAARLRDLGYEVINPAETAGGTIHLPRSTFLRIDIGYVMAAEAVALLPGWSSSKGSKLEVMVAEAMDLPIHFYNEREGLGARFRVEGVEVRGSIVGDRLTRHGEVEDLGVGKIPGLVYWDDVKGEGFVCEHAGCRNTSAIARHPEGFVTFPAYLCAKHCNEAGIRVRPKRGDAAAWLDHVVPNIGKGCGA